MCKRVNMGRRVMKGGCNMRRCDAEAKGSNGDECCGFEEGKKKLIWKER